MTASYLKSKCNPELMENLFSVIAKQGIVVNSHFGWDSPGFWLKITGSQNLLLSTFIKLRANSIPVRPCSVSHNQASTFPNITITTWRLNANSEMAIRLPPTIFLFYMHKTPNYISRLGMTACVSEKSISCFPFVSISLFARFISANLFLFRFGALPFLLFWVGTVNASPIVCWSSVPRLLIFRYCDIATSQQAAGVVVV